MCACVGKNRINTHGVLQAIFSSDITNTIGELKDYAISLITLGPDVVGHALIDVFKTKVMKSLPGGDSMSGHYNFVVAISGCMFAAVAVIELLASRKSGDWAPILTWIFHELNKLVVHSPFRYKNVMRILTRILQYFGPEKSKMLLAGMTTVQNPMESLRSFAHLPSFPHIDDIIKGNMPQTKEASKKVVCPPFHVLSLQKKYDKPTDHTHST